MVTCSTPKYSASFSKEFSLLWATSFLKIEEKADITFSFHKLDKFSSFFSFSTNYVLHFIFFINFCTTIHCFHVPCFVEIVSHCLGSKSGVAFTISHFWIITWLESVCHSDQPTKHTISLYICQVPTSALFTFRHFWIKDHFYARIYFSLAFALKLILLILFETYFSAFWTLAQIVIMKLVLFSVIRTTFKWLNYFLSNIFFLIFFFSPWISSVALFLQC